MKKYMCICLIVVPCIFCLLLDSCKNSEDKNDMDSIFFDKYVMDDSKSLEGNLTNEYDINELRSFFKDSQANERIGFGLDALTLTFSEVNSRYPVEILRTGGYSVYRVSQGGYYYVFWIKPLTAGTDEPNSEPSVYFSAYLSSAISPALFDSLIPGISTAEDVESIDPSFELSFLMSNGIFSYSYLDDETILQIEYEYQGSINGYDDLIVKEKKIVPRASAPSRYSVILAGDIPY